MASPCELLLDVDNAATARRLLSLAQGEARRIEEKFSRYRPDNIIDRINRAAGAPVEVDAETASLLDYAHQCYDLSEGLFDVTSGVLRQVWRFDGSDRLPAQADVAALLPRVGWGKVRWRPPVITLPAGMELDLGGIGKEYAVDRSALLLRQETDASVLVNYGGDLFCSGPRRDGRGWVVGIESPVASPQASRAEVSVRDYEVRRGGIATSGDVRRYLLKDGVRYSHILDPRNGWPVVGAPRSVTVFAPTCTEAGILSTLAMLQGPNAEVFLQAQGVEYWCIW
jgi:thiamine biosynthesis lipoprotein